MDWHAFHLQSLERAGIATGLLLATTLAGLAASRVLFFLLMRLATRAATPLSTLLVQRLRGPLRLLLPLLAVMLAVPPLALSAPAIEFLNHLFSLCTIAAITWIFINSALTGRDLILSRFNMQSEDNLEARTVHTQLTILVKLVLVAIMLVAAATMLMTFDSIRHVGVSLLASAGMIGIILGFAAQHSLATFVAGLQIAFTQPIRIDDVVIVEGEWGKIEEITLTYVVVKLWDLRRLVVPVTYFLEKPFQNWTRSSANLLGTVFLYVDYSVPVDAVRTELQVILQASDKWDGLTSGAQVTNCTERTVELRLLMSAADSSKAFDLRCEVREKLLAFLQKDFPDSLPRVRLHSVAALAVPE
ncbi:MAG: mechanosensitive ion channel [Holophaga sp.]|nr:mechanosensitive ion channel [Holophaga sp.]